MARKASGPRRPTAPGPGETAGTVAPSTVGAGESVAKGTAKGTAKGMAKGMAKGARRTTPSPETLAALGADRLIGLILGETARNPPFKKLVTAALAARQGPDAVSAIVDRRLAALEGARGYVDWQKRRAFATDLDTIVTVILAELQPLDASAALDRLRRFLDGADAVLNRVDDSTGSIQAVYGRAADAFVAAAAGLPAENSARVVLSLLPGFADDPFGPYAAVLHDLIARLPEAALPEIDAELAHLAEAGPAGGGRSEAAFRRTMRRERILRLRQTLADRRGDLDAYIALECAAAPGRPDRTALARRLLAAGRPDEALAWVRRQQKAGIRVVTRADLIAGFDPDAADRERLSTEIEILDALGRGAEAQALRWGQFERALDAPMLRAFLAKLPDFEDEEALRRALAHAAAFPDPHRALHFLVAWPDLPRAARLVRARAADWRGERYAVLAPAADALAGDDPVAATILYRRLLDGILGAGHSGAYGHGARYLLELDGLAGRIAPGAVEPDPAAYREDLRQAHGRKHAFWGLLRG